LTIEMGNPFAGGPPLLLVVEELDVVEVEAALVPEPATTTIVPTIVVGWIWQ
jgi:hypothetical protein